MHDEAVVTPRVLKVDEARADAPAIVEAARVLRSGGLVAFPTETVYGLGGRALDVATVARVFAAKGRPATHPLIVHVLGERDANEVARFDDRAKRLVERFWPGPLTLVLPRLDRVPAEVSGGGDTVGVRAPAHPVARALLEALGEPIAAPSANRYQRLSPTRAEHVVQSLGGAVDLVLDGGPCAVGIESTVLDLVATPPRVLRPGGLSLDQLRAALPDVVADNIVATGERRSPGLDRVHYAPSVPLRLLGRDEALAMQSTDRSIGLLLLPPDLELHLPNVRTIVLSREPGAYARELYAALHTLEAAGVDEIAVEAPPDGEAWWAVRDRLQRAAEATS